jgi:SAM-dependent methyltransferase
VSKPRKYDVERIRRMARSGEHRLAVGGLWDELGDLVLRYLIEQGLEPEMTVLDVGCGALRAGVPLVDHLEPAHYFGVDLTEELLDAGYYIELAGADLTHKLPRNQLVTTGGFELELLPAAASFDVAFAISLFTHIEANTGLRKCLSNLAPRMRPGSVFHATFFLCPDEHPVDEPLHHRPGGITTHHDRNPFHYRADEIVTAAKGLPWKVGPPLEWNHPRAQLMTRFTRTVD